MENATITKPEDETESEQVLTFEDLPGLCRICLKKDEALSDMEVGLIQFYKRCIERPLDVKDELPSKICQRCFSYLDSMDSFIKDTTQNRTQYRNQLIAQGMDDGTLDKEDKAELKRKLQSIKEDPEDKPKKPKIDLDVKEENYELQEEVVEIKDEEEDSDEDIEDGEDEENEEEVDEDEEVDDDEEEDEDEDVGLDSEDEEEDEMEDEEDSDDE